MNMPIRKTRLLVALNSLDLRNNNIGDDGAKHLANLTALATRH